MKSRRIYNLARLHRDAWRIVVIDTHVCSSSESQAYDARIAMRKAVNRLMHTVCELGMPKGYSEWPRITKRDRAAGRRYLRRMAKRVQHNAIKRPSPW